MQGRYGMDEFSRFLTYTGLALMLLSLFQKLNFLSIPAFIIILYSTFRVYSKNTDKRLKERKWYLNVKAKIVNFFDLIKRKWRDRKTHSYFKCPNCKKILRVPKGKGTIRVTCPDCKQEIIKKT